MSWQFFLKSRFATVALSIVLVFVMVVTAKILVQKSIVDNEIAKLQSQMDRVKKDNNQLSSLMQYLKSPDYAESQAREKLNLSKPGEHVVVLTQNEVTGAATSDVPATKSDNFKLWVNYFFNHAD